MVMRGIDSVTTGLISLIVIHAVACGEVIKERVVERRIDEPKRGIQNLISDGILAIFAPVSLAVENTVCRTHSEQYRMGIIAGELWAIKMLDASSKMPTGILQGNLMHLGNFDECLSVSEVDHELGAFSGKHCLGQVGTGRFSEISLHKVATHAMETNRIASRLDKLGGDIEGLLSQFGATFALCIPSSCTARDLERHLRVSLRDILGNTSVHVDDMGCSSKMDEPQFSTLDWFAVFLFGSILALVAISTLYDLAFIYPGSSNGLMVAFSMYSNTRRLLSAQPDSDRYLNVLNGLKVCTIVWVLIYHLMLKTVISPAVNFAQMELNPADWTTQIVTNATLAVDSFFLMSGLLVCYNFLLKREKGETFSLPWHYVHRYIRLTPVYAAVILFASTLLNFLGNGPLWKSNVTELRDMCRKYWFSGITYTSNYFPAITNGCLMETWSLAVDTQLFVLSPLILFPLLRWPRAGKALLGGLIALGMSIAFGVSYFNQIPWNLNPTHDGTEHIQYYATHARFTPWLMGIGLGYILYRTKHVVLVLPRAVVAAAWILSVLAMVTAVLLGGHFFRYDYVYDRMTTSLYTCLVRPIWALGIAWIIFACVKGYGGIINSVLSSSLAEVLSRLVYAMYLVHLSSVFLVILTSKKMSSYLSPQSLIVNYFGLIVLCLPIALIVHLCIEVPSQNIERHFTRTRKAAETLGRKGEKKTN